MTGMEPLVALILFATPIGLLGVGIAHLHRRRKHRKPAKRSRKAAEENLLK